MERHKGYTDALKAHRIALDPALMIPATATRENGAEAIKTLLKGRNPPTAAALL